MDSNNRFLQIAVEGAMVNHPNDKYILESGNKVLEFQRIAVQALNKRLENSDTNTYQVISDFYKNSADILLETAEKSPLFNKKYVEEFLKKHQSKKSISLTNDLKYGIAFQKNLIATTASSYLNYFAMKVGYCDWCFFLKEANLSFNNTLKVGHKNTGKLLIMCNPYCQDREIINLKWKINGKAINESNYKIEFNQTFTDTLPKIFDVEYECQIKNYNMFDITIDSVRLNQQFVIHPTEK